VAASEPAAWILDRLAALGMPAVGPVSQVRERPWSVHLTAPTPAGQVWFKANGPDSAYEAGLVAALAEWAPGSVLTPLAVDASRGWLLSPDGGTILREAGPPSLSQWQAMLVAYAGLQREVAARVPEMLALGVPDQRPERMPDHLAPLLDDPAVRADLGEARHASLAAMAPEYATWCAELAADRIAATLQHDDLHDGNVFLVDGGFRFFDWGDAAVSHPFCSLLVALRVAGLHFGHSLDRLRDAYLEVWSTDADRKTLLRSADLATRVGIVGRSLSWRRALRGAEPPVDPEYSTAVAEWLAELLAVQA
jgi:hypothetical protein